MAEPARSAAQRVIDTRQRLATDVDLWLATADPDTGTPYLIPVSYLWDGETFLVSTPAASRTGRNLKASGQARFALGPTRDVVLVEAAVDVIPAAELPGSVADAFAARTEFDPRTEPNPYLYFRLRPQRIQAWREANELPGRVLMRDGVWLADGQAPH